MKQNNIAFFDFDGTITIDDTLLKFIRFVVGDKKFLVGLFILSPILILYKIKIIPNYKAKQYMLSWYFKGMQKEEFFKVSYEYSMNYIDSIVRQKAKERLLWHKNQGDKIVVVSASIDCWIRPWCEKNGLELIATKLEIKNNKISGKLLTKNCYGQEKVNRIKNQYNLNDYNHIYAYGDSKGDKEMLELANFSFFKPFR
ncbi:HAD-IB family hydrolase [Malaciobacter mytili LMG 24559]|uniref:HAD-IB family hydrolase n=1 Tax=Malaciobacter mytili LMG 24559 TaxID=1032238 RepID=A0AAX2AB90_9BACT|nr:HAD-IB family hydrolase [Malaciobacter mytili]AXH14466.1 HAD superfamily hydrolase, subfamily IB [Malaciobacter mytili LMG 24559]RXK12374.1 HAD-IB family hydrolase [Malaciobacter mytili LMG 24559]